MSELSLRFWKFLKIWSRPWNQDIADYSHRGAIRFKFSTPARQSLFHIWILSKCPLTNYDVAHRLLKTPLTDVEIGDQNWRPKWTRVFTNRILFHKIQSNISGHRRREISTWNSECWPRRSPNNCWCTILCDGEVKRISLFRFRNLKSYQIGWHSY